ncbi:type I restriction-modification system subunit M [Vibrio sp. MACH09]|uniref:type I restriction-modification system subunit M n=1 Tax=Vibrio sp. MACH09 TaxID=3025122 RepID=UPI002792FC44|nr:type I restriction-modification system subunit M [Vibrio sp. MACH09]GLO60571.1 type I restriction-modification system subunit M [Vibrio sp. MACH09]
MVEQHKKELEKKLWDIANSLRGNMSPDDFRDYILGFIFYKYLSEKMDKYGSKLLRQSPEVDTDNFDKLDEELIIDDDLVIDDIKEEAIAELGYFLKPSELFHVIAERGKNGEFILESLGEVLNHIEQSTMGTASEDDFNGLFDDIDFTSNKLGKTEKAKNELITSVLGHLDEIDFCLDDTEIDVLGDAYEYLIGQFASGAGKKAGEFYTPPMVSKLLAKLVTKGKTQLKSAYDPTCGSGSLLLQVAKEIHSKGGEVANYYGQEKNPSTYNLARMNMILHGVHYRSFDIQQDDTLETPHHIEKRFEAVVANPPFSASWSANDGFKSDERFADYGKLAPKSKADFAFVQHMLHQLDDNGTMAVVLPHGVLFRGAAEGHIRKYLIEQKNCLDAVIGLPANIFYGTSIPTCILVLKKQRKASDNILFIDASAHCGKATNQNFLREEDLERILEAVEKREFVDKFSYVATQEEVKKKNDFNLNMPRYVDTFEEEELIDLEKVSSLFSENVSSIHVIDKSISDFCLELGITAPMERES